MVSPLRERHERRKLSISTKITVNVPVKDLGQVGRVPHSSGFAISPLSPTRSGAGDSSRYAEAILQLRGESTECIDELVDMAVAARGLPVDGRQAHHAAEARTLWSRTFEGN